MLPERLSFYGDRGANQIARIRGFILASFEQTGLPQPALPFVLEALESERNAYLVAAAAAAVRGMQERTVQVVPYLLKAVSNIRYIDDTVTFEKYRPEWPFENPTTALQEILATFEWLGGYAKEAVSPLVDMLGGENGAPANANVRAKLSEVVQVIDSAPPTPSSCCRAPTLHARKRRPTRSQLADVLTIRLQDQGGEWVSFREFFTESLTVVVFFYTRCGNPNKCSQTVTKLGALQREIALAGFERGIKTAGITYDPNFDQSDRLKSYGESRGILLDKHNRLFRADPVRFDELENYFELGVNYSSTVVNQHQVELYILDENGNIETDAVRVQWSVEEVIDALKKMIERPAQRSSGIGRLVRKGSGALSSGLAPLAIAFAPKCPICWGAYLSTMGIAGANLAPYSAWFRPLLVFAMVLHLWSLFRGAQHRNGLLPFFVSAAGVAVMLAFVAGTEVRGIAYVGMALILVGSMTNSLPFMIYRRIAGTLSDAFRSVVPRCSSEKIRPKGTR